MDQKTLKQIQEIINQALKNVTTKDDFKDFATKDDLKHFATKDDLKNFATKKDLERFATKDDFKHELSKLNKDIVREIEDLSEFITTLDKQKTDRIETEALKQRVDILEKDLRAL